MQKVAATIFAAVALQGCGEDKKATTTIRGSGQEAITSISATDVEALKNKAKKKVHQFVKTAQLNGLVSQGFNAIKQSGYSPDKISTSQEELKKWAYKAQHEITKGEQQVVSQIPDFQNKVLELLKDNKASDFVKQMETYTNTINAQDIQSEVDNMVKGFDVFSAEQLHSFHKATSQLIHSTQQTIGNSPMSPQYVRDLTKKANDAQHEVIAKFEKAPLKKLADAAIQYETKLYADIDFKQLSKGAKTLQNGLTEKTVKAELEAAQKMATRTLA